MADDRPEAAARCARAQGADLAQERPLHVGHLTGTVTGLARHRLHARPTRFDVVAVEIRGTSVAIEHVVDAFDAG